MKKLKLAISAARYSLLPVPMARTAQHGIQARDLRPPPLVTWTKRFGALGASNGMGQLQESCGVVCLRYICWRMRICLEKGGKEGGWLEARIGGWIFVGKT